MVHKMFFDAMLVAGVNVAIAKSMYVAVLCGGPRWDEMTVEGARIAFNQKTKLRSTKKKPRLKLNPKSKTIKFGRPIGPSLLYEIHRKAKAITQIDFDLPIKLQSTTGTVPEISDLLLYGQTLKLNIPQKTCHITKIDKDDIIEFANTNPSIDDIEKYSDSFRLKKGITPQTTLLDAQRYMRKQKIHIIKSNDQNYLLKNTPLSEKNIERLANSRINIQRITNTGFGLR